jgi:hypothetical protein
MHWAFCEWQHHRCTQHSFALRPRVPHSSQPYRDEWDVKLPLDRLVSSKTPAIPRVNPKNHLSSTN